MILEVKAKEKSFGRLTRRAQVQDTLEEQGDPERAWWTSPESLVRRCPV